MQVWIIEHEAGTQAWRGPAPSAYHSLEKVHQRHYLQEARAVTMVKDALSFPQLWWPIRHNIVRRCETGTLGPNRRIAYAGADDIAFTRSQPAPSLERRVLESLAAETTIADRDGFELNLDVLCRC